ncbi:BMP family lipoprotein [Humibacter albus]|uniref:BMP family lipoprotein n=1 Tax=Humibacter albus TaxID=427754 RepID=UPI0003B45DE6|nr:BMP family ABC transporter substrate-binding protein [Humibacter albus]
MKSRAQGIASVAVTLGAALLLTACGAAPATGSAKASSTGLPCVVSDDGGFNDHSFNQLSLEGIQAGAKKTGSAYKSVQSKTTNDYAPNVNQLVSAKCTLVVAAGFPLVPAVKAASKANPKTDFAVVDNDQITSANVKNIVFQSNEAAFMGGYTAAAYSKTGVVATYGGQEIPPVTLYMDGFWDGVQYYNKQKNKDVRVLGWNEETQKGTFVGNFTDQNASKTIATNFIDQRADVIVPVAGTLYQGAGAAIRAAGNTAVLEGVDADLYATDTNGYQDLMLTSILKNVKTAVEAVVVQSADAGTFDNAEYVGTLKNGGVGLAPFHRFASKVPSSLSQELAQIKAGIIDGSIKVPSSSAIK